MPGTHIDIKTCYWLSPRWLELVREGYATEIISDERVAVMSRGMAARDMVRNTDFPQQWRKKLAQ